MKTASVTVRCHGCGEPRELTRRSARRAGLCKRCLYPARISPSNAHRRFWLTRFSDTELAGMASEMAGRAINPSVFTPHRTALLGSAAAPETDS